MKNINDIPAFPRTVNINDGIGDYNVRYQDGMSLRDYFAGQALVGLLACPRTGYGNKVNPDDIDNPIPITISERCYELADTLLAQRSK